MYVVVCYDISDNRRRTRLHETLLGYGDPVQESVFECDLTAKQFQQMRARTRRFTKKKGESIRYYLMCGACQRRTQVEGTALVEAGQPRDFEV